MKQYDTAYRKWWIFCKNYKMDVYQPSTNSFVQFLNEQYKNGASYSTLNTYRSAINFIINTKVDEKIINRFLKGVFKLRPVFPKYKTTWDPSIVLKFVATFFPLDTLTLEQLSLKLATLLALCTGHRLQTFSKIKINNIVNLGTRIEVMIFDILKNSAPSKQQPKLVLPFFPDKPELCIASTLLFYIESTRTIRGQVSNLFITHKKPHRSASVQTISRWIKTTLKRSGVDTNVFTAYSTRHASTSAAFKAGTSIETIRVTAGWSKESETFFRYYNRPIVDQGDFARNVLGF